MNLFSTEISDSLIIDPPKADFFIIKDLFDNESSKPESKER